MLILSARITQSVNHTAKSGYDMKAGDILVVYGADSSSAIIGHAAIATSSGYILKMPGYGHHAWHSHKRNFLREIQEMDAMLLVIA